MKEWTVMVYMAGDNNLSIDMAYALNDIKRALADDGDCSKLNLLAYFDGNSPDVPTLYCDFTDHKNPQFVPAATVEKRFPEGRDEAAKVLVLGEENSAAAYSIMNFVNWCVEQVAYEEEGEKLNGRKAENYAIVFSGHGSGFQSFTLMKDNSSNFYLTIRKLRWALEELIEKVLPKDEKFAVLGFDSCVMSMLEVAFELKHVSKTMIASEGTIPNAGWTYEPILKTIAQSNVTSDEDIIDVSKGIVDCFLDTQANFAVGGVSVDLAAWDLQKVPPVVESINKLGEILLVGLKDEKLKGVLELVLLKCHYKTQSFMFEQNVDLVDFCELLEKEFDLLPDNEVELTQFKPELGKHSFKTALAEICSEVIESVNSCILSNGFSGGRFQHSNGIAVFFPWTYMIYLLSMRTYDNLRFVHRNTGAYWREFLHFYLSDVTLRDRSEHVGKVIEVIESRTTENPKTKTTENPKTRLVEAAAGIDLVDNPNRTTENPKTRVIENTATRTTENPLTRTIENPLTRLLGGLSLFLYEFKNVATPWFVTGYNDRRKKDSYSEQKAGSSD